MTENRRIVIEKENGEHLEEIIVSKEEADEILTLIDSMLLIQVK